MDVSASEKVKETKVSINDPVTNLVGLGYEQGQKNLDGSDL
jgi:hypothetical protein